MLQFLPQMNGPSIAQSLQRACKNLPPQAQPIGQDLDIFGKKKRAEGL